MEDKTWHPLLLHLLDVAAAADAVLEREPRSTRDRMAQTLGFSKWEKARSWLLFIVACHDLGKAAPGFQWRWEIGRERSVEAGFKFPPGLDTHVRHNFISQILLRKFLFEKKGWPEDLASHVADAVGCHHGERASPTMLDSLEFNRRVWGDKDWAAIYESLIKVLEGVFNPEESPVKERLSGPDFMLIAGWTSFSDWIGSNVAWFPFGLQSDCAEPEKWFERRRTCAEKALDEIGWNPRKPLEPAPGRPFKEIFPFEPCSLQVAALSLAAKATVPGVLLMEAPMGEGKTEAAFAVYLDLQRRFDHRGLYIALPTKATGNAMFKRTLEFLQNSHFSVGHTLDLQLVHGGATLNKAFSDLSKVHIDDSDENGGVRAGEWFSSKKKALLSEYGVGTIDQALLTILPVKHGFMRLWGLANRLVIFDEIHAYDAYTGTLLITLIRWLTALGSSVILLSATLPPKFRRDLAQKLGLKLPETEEAYPRLSLFQPGRVDVEQTRFEPDENRRLEVKLEGIAPDLPTLRATLEERLATGGLALALVNTVQRAQDLYREFSAGERILEAGSIVGKKLEDGTEVYLFHARFPADKRQVREDLALKTFGKDGEREGKKKILIATQVAEQSLDLDFDVMISDLAPVDLLLQRAGRLWRNHKRPIESRRQEKPRFIVAALTGEEPCDFGDPLWWGNVYSEDILLRTWVALRNRSILILPDAIDALVRSVYEDEVEMPENLRERMERTVKAEGKAIARRIIANQSVIGFPEDASWDDPSRFIKNDEDEVGLHRSLVAQTRLGEPSVVAIPLYPSDEFDFQKIPHSKRSHEDLYRRAMSLSRKEVVSKLRAVGVPEGWKESPLLRQNCLPMVMDDDGRWRERARIRLDEEMGLVYEPKEVE